MTIGIGLLCQEGAIVATDTKVTLTDWSVTHGEKLIGVKASWGSCVIANSTDDGNAAKTLVRKVSTALDKGTVADWLNVENIVTREMTNWAKPWRQLPPVQLLLACSVTGLGTRLYLCEPPNTIQPHSESYLAIGSGAAVTDPLFKTLFGTFSLHYEAQKAMRIVAYLMRRAKEGNAFCGGRTQAILVRKDGEQPEVINSFDCEEGENQSRKLDFLLGATATLAFFSNPGENLEHNAKGLGDMMKSLEGLRGTVFHNVNGNVIGQPE